MRLYDIAIAGAGPGGLIAAILLARSGAHVAIFEAGSSFEREYRGETLTPGTQRVLADLGLDDAVRALGGSEPAGISITVGGRTSEIDLVADPTKRVRQVPQTALLGLLADVARSSGAHVELGARIRGLHRGNGRVAGFVLATGNARTGETIGARLVIAADGRFSAARHEAGIELKKTRVPFDLIWTSGSGGGRRVHVIVDDGDAFVAFPTAAHGAQIGWLIPKGTYSSVRAHGIDWIRERIGRALRTAPEHVEARIDGFDDLALLPTVSEVARQWSVPGLLLIGDAAHPMSPVAGQGINVAIADAVVAARTLAVLVRDSATDAKIDAALLAVQRERAPAVARIARQQNLLPGVLRLLGAERTLGTIAPVAQTLVRRGNIPAVLRDAVDRFLLGDPPVRADHGPWVTAPRVEERP